jgi:hypothetical protein
MLSPKNIYLINKNGPSSESGAHSKQCDKNGRGNNPNLSSPTRANLNLSL